MKIKFLKEITGAYDRGTKVRAYRQEQIYAVPAEIDEHVANSFLKRKIAVEIKPNEPQETKVIVPQEKKVIESKETKRKSYTRYKKKK